MRSGRRWKAQDYLEVGDVFDAKIRPHNWERCVAQGQLTPRITRHV